jgi:hypothetical protein
MWKRQERLMTWRQLLAILQNMEKVNHSCMDKEVMMLDSVVYPIDLHESLHTGDVVFTQSIITEEP